MPPERDSLFGNTLERIIHGPGMTVDESSEAAMVLFVSVGCLADVRRAAEYTMGFAQSTHAGRLTTPTAVRQQIPRTRKVFWTVSQFLVYFV